uniref:Uncharacterized protein n=1 Tax=Arundo donax TaxID=35708 RepID=A0A0A8ZDR3_ARUDO
MPQIATQSDHNPVLRNTITPL